VLSRYKGERRKAERDAKTFFRKKVWGDAGSGDSNLERNHLR